MGVGVRGYGPGMDAPETVTDAVRLLADRGYREDVRLVDATLPCPACGHLNHAPDLVVRETYRVEGASDPGDAAIVLGVECRHCGDREILVSAYGADADQQLPELVAALEYP